MTLTSSTTKPTAATARRTALALALFVWAAPAAFGPWALAQAAEPESSALADFRSFLRDVKAGRADFTQTVRSPDGAKTRVSTGRFEFFRPNRFRFTYLKPYPQTIVSDGQKVWFHDPDLNQVTVRKLGDALGATPAALLAGQAVEQDFDLKALPDRDGLAWLQATPRRKEGTIDSLQLGFRGHTLAALEIADSFGQRSLLKFDSFQIEPSLPAELFRFVMPAGADLAEPAL
jgi:outer membrane lipoprotein carrier protein